AAAVVAFFAAPAAFFATVVAFFATLARVVATVFFTRSTTGSAAGSAGAASLPVSDSGAWASVVAGASAAVETSGVLAASSLRVAVTPLPLLMGPPGARCAWSSGQTRWIRAPCGQEGRGGRPEQRAPRPVTSELAVVAFLEGIEQVGGGVGLAVVFDLLVALDLHHRAVFQLEAVQGV